MFGRSGGCLGGLGVFRGSGGVQGRLGGVQGGLGQAGGCLWGLGVAEGPRGGGFWGADPPRDPPSAPPGDVSIGIKCAPGVVGPAEADIDFDIIRNDNDTFTVRYTPRGPGAYTIMVLFADQVGLGGSGGGTTRALGVRGADFGVPPPQATPTSPIRIKVDPSHDASKVKAEGPGLSRSGESGSPQGGAWGAPAGIWGPPPTPPSLPVRCGAGEAHPLHGERQGGGPGPPGRAGDGARQGRSCAGPGGDRQPRRHPHRQVHPPAAGKGGHPKIPASSPKIHPLQQVTGGHPKIPAPHHRNAPSRRHVAPRPSPVHHGGAVSPPTLALGTPTATLPSLPPPPG